MTALTIRSLSSDVYERLKEQAKQHRRSVAQEAAFVIEEAVGRAEAPDEIWRQVDRLREVIRNRYGAFPESAALVREDRQR